jgi:hypothetical protein
MTGRLPWHPFLFTVVIVLTAWLDAAVSPYAAFRSLAVALLIAALLTGVAGLALRSVQAGAIVASATIGVLWSKKLLTTIVDIGTRMGPLVIVWGLLIVVALFLAVRAVRRLAPRLTRESVTVALNRSSLLLVVVAFAFGLVNGRMAATSSDLDQGVGIAEWPAGDRGTPPRPDIFVILLDGYPRADVLDFAFDFDNAPFLDALTDRGFEVAGVSHSDYLWTHVSVPSVLNLAYVEQIPALLEVIQGQAPRQPTLRTTIADNVAFDVAREHDYTPVGVASGFEEVAPRLADVYVDGGQLNEFETSLLVSTFAGDIVAAVAPDFASAQQRDRIRYNLGVLPDIASRPDRAPAFTWAHVPAPHQPVVFGEGGEPVVVPISDTFYADSPHERGEDPAEFIERYRAQLPYLNDLVLEAVDDILATSTVPPVIILLADHGSASAVDWVVTDPATADPARLLERTGTLFAALTPGKPDLFPDDTSPVNIMRLLFDAYLGTDYGRATPPADGGQIPPIDASVLDP